MQETTFKPSKKQYEAWEYLTDDTTTELGYGGGASGGKSYLGCVWITTMCLAYPDTAWLIGRKELTNLKRTTIITLFKVFKDFGLDTTMYQYNQQNNIITFSNGSQIFFLDLGYKPSDPLFTRLGGLELTGAFVDEANEIPIEAINILKTRLGRRGTLKPKILETFNPDKGHVYSRYYRPHKEGKLPPHRKFIPALATDNPYTTEEYLEQLRNSDKITKERLLFGNFEYDDDPSILVNTDAFEDLFTNTVNRKEKFLSIDVARYGKDKTAIGLWNGYELSKVYIYEKYGIDQLSDVIKTLASQEQIPYSHIIIDEDGIGGGLVDNLRGVKGFMGNSIPFEIWDTRQFKFIPANFQNLKAQCYFTLADMINNHKLSVKDETIKELLREDLSAIRQKNQDSDGKLAIISKDDMKDIIGRSPDISDMMMMRMYFEFKKPNEMQTIEQRARAMVNRKKLSVNQVE